MEIKAYAHATLPCHWVIDLDGVLYLVPAIHLGWIKRRPLANKQMIDTAAPVDVGHLFHLGLPNAIPVTEPA